MANIRQNQTGLVGNTRHTLDEDHFLEHVMPRVFHRGSRTAQRLRSNQSDMAVAVAIVAHSYARLILLTMRSIVGHDVLLSLALQDSVDGPTDECSRSPVTVAGGAGAKAFYKPYRTASATSELHMAATGYKGRQDAWRPRVIK